MLLKMLLEGHVLISFGDAFQMESMYVIIIIHFFFISWKINLCFFSSCFLVICFRTMIHGVMLYVMVKTRI